MEEEEEMLSPGCLSCWICTRAGIKELDILQLDQEQSGAAPPYPSPFLRLEAASAPPATPPSCQGW